MTRGSRLTATVAGQPSHAAPIVGAAWAALRAALLVAPGRWHDSLDLADRVAALLDCRPALCDELILTAADAGLIETRTHLGVEQVRVTEQEETP